MASSENPLQCASVAVVIPAYNRAKLILDTLNSVLSQTLQPSLVVVVDDGSIDETKRVIEDWVKLTKFKFKFKYVYQYNRGVSAARNTGINIAKNYDWIAFLDSDDLWPQDLLSRLYNQVRNDRQYVACSAETSENFYELDNTLISSYLFSHEKGYDHHGPLGFTLAPIPISATIYRSDIVVKVNGFDEKMRYGEDKLFAMFVSVHGLWGRVCGDPIIYRNYKKSLNSNQLSNKPHQNSRVRYARLLDERLNSLLVSDENEVWHRGIKVALWKGWHRAGRHLEMNRHHTWALAYYLRAAKYRPVSKSTLRVLLMYVRVLIHKRIRRG